MSENLNTNAQYQKNKKTLHFDKSLPYDELCERTVIAALIFEFDRNYKVISKLTSEMFYNKKHSDIYSVIVELNSLGQQIDMISVTTRCKSKYKDITPFDIAKFNEDHIKLSDFHTHIVFQRYIQRRLIIISEEYKEQFFSNPDNVLEMIDEFSAKIANVIPNNIGGDYKSARTVSEELKRIFNDKFDGINENSVLDKVYKTGFKQFDKCVSIQRNRLITIAGYPSHGKSKFVQKCIFNILDKYSDEVSVEWISTEETAAEIQICYSSSVIFEKPKDISNMNFDPSKKNDLIKSFDDYQKFDIVTTEKIAQITKIANHHREFCKRRPNKFNILVVDNILTLEDSNGTISNDDYIWKELVRLKQDINQYGNGCIIAIHHYKKEMRSNEEIIQDAGRPILSALKGSEACERSSNVVLLLNNMGMRKSLIAEYPEEDQEILKHLVIIDPAKNRNDNNIEGDTMMRFLINLDFNLWQEVV